MFEELARDPLGEGGRGIFSSFRDHESERPWSVSRRLQGGTHQHRQRVGRRLRCSNEPAVGDDYQVLRSYGDDVATVDESHGHAMIRGRTPVVNWVVADVPKLTIEMGGAGEIYHAHASTRR